MSSVGSATAGRVERGATIAAVLAGSWRDPPPPSTLTPAELADLAPLLLSTGAGALAFWRLRGTALQSAPDALPLKQAYRLHTLQAAVHVEQIRVALACLQAAGVEALLAKGWAAARLYPEDGLRPYGDIDLYVRPAEYPAAEAALFGSGAPPVPVDLHRGFAELDDRDVAGLFARARTIPLGDVEVRIPGPEDHLRLLCLHLMRHGAARPLWICDVGAALESLPPGFDWGHFLSGQRRRTDAVVCALVLAHRFLEARLESTPVAASVEKAPAWLFPTVVREWGAASVRREPMGSFLHRPAGALAELLRHWPNAIEGTMGVGGPFNGLPRWPFQVSYVLVRTLRFAADLPRLLRAGALRARR